MESLVPLLVSLFTGAVIPCVLWVLDRRRYAIRLRVKVWRVRKGRGRGLLRLRLINHSGRDVFVERVEIRHAGEKGYGRVKGVLDMPVSLAPGAAQTVVVHPGTNKMLALEAQPRVHVLTACERVFEALWIDGVADD